MRVENPGAVPGGHEARLDTENPSTDSPLVFGAGLTGLSAAHELNRSGRGPVVFEAGDVVGGLSRTVVFGEFRYDIGGHRFFTKDAELSRFVTELMGDELLSVERTSKIFMRGRFFDYPLRPGNAIFGLGPVTVLRILLDYAIEKLRAAMGLGPKALVSLEDWVVSRFGRTMFNIYFREYSEKVWGIDCSQISSSWVSKRIQGLSLWAAVKNAFTRVSGKDIPTLVDVFDYPALGIGRLSERLQDEINVGGSVMTGSRLTGLRHDGKSILSAEVTTPEGPVTARGSHYLSTVPLDSLVRSLSPSAPADVIEAARGLGFRDLVLVSVSVDREDVTGESWVYIPEKKFAFGRLHEPSNWSARMAPPGKTLVVAEYFSFKGDDIWNTSDERLSEMTISGLEELGYIRPHEVISTEVLRVPGAYPLFEVGYEEKVQVVMRFLERFNNLSVAGRSGVFSYLNMDHAMLAGMEAAREVLKKAPPR